MTAAKKEEEEEDARQSNTKKILLGGVETKSEKRGEKFFVSSTSSPSFVVCPVLDGWLVGWVLQGKRSSFSLLLLSAKFALLI